MSVVDCIIVSATKNVSKNTTCCQQKLIFVLHDEDDTLP